MSSNVSSDAVGGSTMCCSRVTKLRLLEKLILHLLLLVRTTVPHLLDHMMLQHLLFDILLLVRVSGL